MSGDLVLRGCTPRTEYGKEIQVDIYHVDAMACYKFAELILDALYNFVSVRRKTSLEVPIGELPIPVIEREEPILNHVFGFATPLLTEQDAEISKEDFMS